MQPDQEGRDLPGAAALLQAVLRVYPKTRKFPGRWGTSTGFRIDSEQLFYTVLAGVARIVVSVSLVQKQLTCGSGHQGLLRVDGRNHKMQQAVLAQQQLLLAHQQVAR